uniref:J domain-containing protein n=1 Tax=Oryza meridionalis TaxID=40149 RepID=A0A0E0C0Q3_9ORYZ
MASDGGGDHYRTLGIGRGASKAEVKAAFCRLAQLHHPDRHHAATSDAAASRFRAAYDVYGVLYNDAARAAYDLRLRSSSSSSSSAAAATSGSSSGAYRHGRSGAASASASSGPTGSGSAGYRHRRGGGHTHGDATGSASSSSGPSRSGYRQGGDGGGGGAHDGWRGVPAKNKC